MPTDSSILGFGNLWYAAPLENAQKLKIGQIEIRLAPYFIAPKLEAFRGRGKGDYRMSHDLKDIVTVVDGRAELLGAVRTSPKNLEQYLSTEFQTLLSNRVFLEALPGHLLPTPRANNDWT